VPAGPQGRGDATQHECPAQADNGLTGMEQLSPALSEFEVQGAGIPPWSQSLPHRRID
jgi:hypothetical protein